MDGMLEATVLQVIRVCRMHVSHYYVRVKPVVFANDVSCVIYYIIHYISHYTYIMTVCPEISILSNTIRAPHSNGQGCVRVVVEC